MAFPKNISDEKTEAEHSGGTWPGRTPALSTEAIREVLSRNGQLSPIKD